MEKQNTVMQHESPRRRLRRQPLVWFAASVTGFVLSGFRADAAPQPGVAQQQAESLKQRQVQQEQMQASASAATDEPPETYPGENKDLGPQLLLKSKPKAKAKPLFEFTADTMFSWTSNAFSDASHPNEAGVVAETMSLAIAPEARDLWIGKFSWRAGYRHLLWFYDIAKTKGSASTTPLNGNNFEMGSVFLGGNFSFNEKWNLSLGLDYNRILTDEGISGNPADFSIARSADYSKWTESFVEWNPNWSLSRNITLAEKVALNVSYSGGYHFTTTAPPFMPPYLGAEGRTNSSDKLDNSLTLSLMWTPSSKFVVSPNVRFTHSLYTQPQSYGTVRRDRLVSPGINLIWMPTPRWSVRWSVSGEFKHTNVSESPSYSKLDAATGVTLTLKF